MEYGGLEARITAETELTDALPAFLLLFTGAKHAISSVFTLISTPGSSFLPLRPFAFEIGLNVEVC